MDENLRYYLENTIAKKPAIESRLTHPITNLRYPNRSAFVLLRKYADDFLKTGYEPRFVSLAGIRGVGKTTLLWQTAHYIYHNHHKDIIVMYLKRVLTDGVISFLTGSHEANPDLVIETRDKPVLLEIGTGKTSTRQITQSNVNYRYGLLVSNGITSPNLVGDCIQTPLSWFLLL